MFQYYYFFSALVKEVWVLLFLLSFFDLLLTCALSSILFESGVDEISLEVEVFFVLSFLFDGIEFSLI
jgi:hypothetical protein